MQVLHDPAQDGVSRETRDRFSLYEDLLRRWNRSINLVSSRSLADFQRRHLADSLQLLGLVSPSARHWIDFGAGAGFPALPVAIIASETLPFLRFVLIESDQRKAAFLETVIRQTGVHASVRIERAEAVEPLSADVVSARAFADLETLLKLMYTHGRVGCTGLFPKGRSVNEELAGVRKRWTFSLEIEQSRTHPNGVILKIGDLSRVS